MCTLWQSCMCPGPRASANPQPSSWMDSRDFPPPQAHPTTPRAHLPPLLPSTSGRRHAPTNPPTPVPHLPPQFFQCLDGGMPPPTVLPVPIPHPCSLHPRTEVCPHQPSHHCWRMPTQHRPCALRCQDSVFARPVYTRTADKAWRFNRAIVQDILVACKHAVEACPPAEEVRIAFYCRSSGISWGRGVGLPPLPPFAMQATSEPCPPTGCPEANRHRQSPSQLLLPPPYSLRRSGRHRSVAMAEMVRFALVTTTRHTVHTEHLSRFWWGMCVPCCRRERAGGPRCTECFGRAGALKVATLMEVAELWRGL